MTRDMLRAKIHRITVTESDLQYEGSLTLDTELMDAAGMVPYERVDVYDIDNGSRFSTYLIEGDRGSGVCCVNGAAAHLVEPGHKLILASYVAVDEAELREHRPKIVLIGDGNRVKKLGSGEKARVRFSA